MPLSGRSASWSGVELERAHGKPEVAQAILDQKLRALLRAEDAGDPHQPLQEVDRVREPNLDFAPQGCVRFHHGMRNRLSFSSARTGSFARREPSWRPTLGPYGTAGRADYFNLNVGARRETLPFSLRPSIENTEEA